MSQRSTILTPVRSLCKAFASGTASTEDLLTYFICDAPILSPSSTLSASANPTAPDLPISDKLTTATETPAQNASRSTNPLFSSSSSSPCLSPTSTLTEPQQPHVKSDYEGGAIAVAITGVETRGEMASSKALIPFIYEHGHPALAPFLGQEFRGTKAVAEYFNLLAKYLSYSEMRFENEDDWVVDIAARAVMLKGQARFVWKETGQGWNEQFCWRVVVGKDVCKSFLSASQKRKNGGSSESVTIGGVLGNRIINEDGDSGDSTDDVGVGIGAGGHLGSTTAIATDTVDTTVAEGRAKPAAVGFGKENRIWPYESVGALKIQEYEVWADTGCVYLASKGLLDQAVGVNPRQAPMGSSGPENPKRMNEGIPGDKLNMGMNV